MVLYFSQGHGDGHPLVAKPLTEPSLSPPLCVRGLYIATGQYSSFCGCALGLMLGVLDIMGVEIQDREQVEVRENVEARETEEEDKTRKQQTLRHVMTCGGTCFMQTRRATP